MPRKNSLKTYIKDGYYHIYNRGVEKRNIFQDNLDRITFLNYLKCSLLPPPDPQDIKVTFTLQGLPFKGIPRMPKNYNGKIDLIAYCLMPNHFHLLVKQKQERVINSFMTSVMTRYSMYFNKKYDRVGGLFQGPYKAVLISDDNYLLHLSRYIHLNPLEYTRNLTKAYSSYCEYLGLRKTQWVRPDFVLSYFNQTLSPESNKVNTYKDFVEKYKEESSEILEKLTLED